MASAGKRSNSQYLTECFRDHTGRQRRITTKETDRKKAQRLADKYEKASRTKRTLKQAQAVLDRLFNPPGGSAEPFRPRRPHTRPLKGKIAHTPPLHNICKGSFCDLDPPPGLCERNASGRSPVSGQ